MKTKMLYQRLFFLLSLLTFLGFVFYGFADFDGKYISKFYNSDTCYIPSIYNDLFVDGIGLSGWRFNIAPNFFPDMPMYFIIHGLTNNIVYSGFIYGIVQNLFIALIILLIFKQVFKKDALLKSGFIILLFSASFLCMTFSRNYDYSFNLLINGFHTSAFVLSLLSLGIWLRFKSSGKNLYYFIIFFIALLASLSDKLYIFGYIIPISIIFVFQLLFLKGYKSDRKFFLISIAGAIAGIFLYYFIDNNTPIAYMQKPLEINYESILNSFGIMQKYYGIIFRNVHLIPVVIVLIIISISYSVYKIITITRKGDKTKDDLIKLSIHLFIVINIFCVFLGPILTAVIKWPAQIRYNIFYFYMGIICVGYNLLDLIKLLKNNRRILQFFLLIPLGLLIYLNVKKDSINKLKNNLNYKPDYIEFVDEVNSKYDLKRGLADYWIAKQSTHFNTSDLDVYAIYGNNLYPRIHNAGNKYWYVSKNEENPIVFNFFIIRDNDLNVKIIENIFGVNNIKTVEKNNIKLLITSDFYLRNQDYKINLVQKDEI